ncbi:hypothetical protein TcasGA2_TC009060 [Tribolium castaneum]|uniref:Uncharacterized protein n=1 Tax=Tribolium castaneum TaxID=7070 RepID=D6WPJ6_TRICA|nr:hypothetical protein TcasGA2_TC009060 [Tribolium castaneum]
MLLRIIGCLFTAGKFTPDRDEKVGLGFLDLFFLCSKYDGFNKLEVSKQLLQRMRGQCSKRTTGISIKICAFDLFAFKGYLKQKYQRCKRNKKINFIIGASRFFKAELILVKAKKKEFVNT